MYSNSLCKHIIPNTSHLHRISGEHPASINKGWSLECNRIIPLIHNQHPHNPLISIDNKISTEFKAILFTFC